MQTLDQRQSQQTKSQAAIQPNANLLVMSAVNGFIVKEDGPYRSSMGDGPQMLVFESLAGLHQFLSEHFTHRAKSVVTDAIPIVRVKDLAEQLHDAAKESGILGTTMIPCIQKLPPHQKRVVDEHNDLAGRADRLVAFIEGDVFSGLPEPEKSDLVEQLALMRKLLEVLSRRNRRFLWGEQA